jgi:transposase
MEKATIIGIDLAKRVFQVHAAAKDGRPVLRKKVTRAQLLGFLAKQPPAVVAMEACATAPNWGRAISGLGHDVRLVAPIYVKPFVRRQKNDAADAEAIAEAASRPTMRFGALKTEEQQARSMIFRTRDLLVRQRTQLVNALRGHLAEHGIVAAHGLANVKALATALQDTGSLHPLVCELGQRYLGHIARLDVEIAELDKRLRRPSKDDDETVKRLQTMPGMGPITAAAIEAFAPPMATFKRGPRLCRLARSRSAATHDRREAEAGADVKDGAARYPPASDHRRDDRRQMGRPQGRGQGVVAGPNASREAALGGGHRAGQQDGPFGLGDAQQG